MSTLGRNLFTTQVIRNETTEIKLRGIGWESIGIIRSNAVFI